jgi:hypothetical protein
MPVSTLDVGLLINQGTDQAFGATIGALGIGEQSGWNVKARYRRWLVDYVGLDFAVGGGVYGDYVYKRRGGTAEVALQFGDVIAVTAGVNTYTPRAIEPMQGRRLVATAGVRLGSYPTLLILDFLTRLAGRR